MAKAGHCEIEVTVDALPLGLKLVTEGGKCKVGKSTRPGIQVSDVISCLNEQSMPRGLRSDEVEAVLQLAKLPFQLVVTRKVSAEQRNVKGLQRGIIRRKQVGMRGSPCFQSVNVTLGHCTFSPLGFMFQTCTDGSHRIIFIDPSGAAGFQKVRVGDCIVGVNYKPLGFGVSHDEAAENIRTAKKPFTLNLTRRRTKDADELASLVRQVKTAQACKEIIGVKDKEINHLREQLATERQCDVHSADEEVKEVRTKAQAEVKRLKAELAGLQAILTAKKIGSTEKENACYNTSSCKGECGMKGEHQKQGPAGSMPQVERKRSHLGGVIGIIRRTRC